MFVLLSNAESVPPWSCTYKLGGVELRKTYFYVGGFHLEFFIMLNFRICFAGLPEEGQVEASLFAPTMPDSFRLDILQRFQTLERKIRKIFLSKHHFSPT